ncbi:hypothetical protein Bca52824_090699 [Brassica carinata]|uniref:Exostosin GT47 domain-containing protein n=1 Tax=Brassica carinata TaxID=52824 RepID=A0A8X7TG68_BRACI|nr:hypothetical protein Bca52824_090699 [Brassica carinata]
MTIVKPSSQLFLLLATAVFKRITPHPRRPHFPLPLLPLSQFPPHFAAVSHRSRRESEPSRDLPSDQEHDSGCVLAATMGFIPHKDVALPQVLQPFALPAGGNDVENRARYFEQQDKQGDGHLVYQKRFYRTKFCICPGGSQVNSARITDSIHYGCVPVILSDYYDLPFNDILNWRKFAVQKHFQWNSPPVKFDAFHMIMYELWLRHHVIKY